MAYGQWVLRHMGRLILHMILNPSSHITGCRVPAGVHHITGMCGLNRLIGMWGVPERRSFHTWVFIEAWDRVHAHACVKYDAAWLMICWVPIWVYGHVDAPKQPQSSTWLLVCNSADAISSMLSLSAYMWLHVDTSSSVKNPWWGCAYKMQCCVGLDLVGRDGHRVLVLWHSVHGHAGSRNHYRSVVWH